VTVTEALWLALGELPHGVGAREVVIRREDGLSVEVNYTTHGGEVRCSHYELSEGSIARASDPSLAALIHTVLDIHDRTAPAR
jgi:hypothetical protein